eukprot:SAG31_NODE_32918_length_350_cov_0.808765_1_plen_71_part_10
MRCCTVRCYTRFQIAFNIISLVVIFTIPIWQVQIALVAIVLIPVMSNTLGMCRAPLVCKIQMNSDDAMHLQ